MTYLQDQLRYTLILSLFLAFYSVTPWVGEQIGIYVPLWLLGETVLIVVAAVLIWRCVFTLRAASPDPNLLLSAESRRELLWRLSEEPGLERYGWPWQLKRVGAWWATARALPPP